MADSKITELTRILITPMQEVENAFQQILAARDPNFAEDDALHLLGKLVGQKWAGESNSLFRRFVRARIRANESNGDPEDILAVFVLLVSDPAATLAFINTGDAGFELRIENIVTTDDLATAYVLKFLRKIASGGVNAILETWVAPATGLIGFGNGGDVYAPDADGAGLGNDSDPSIGGVAASYRS